MSAMAKGPIAFGKGVQVFEAGKGFKEAFKKWKAETEKRGRLEITNTKDTEGIVVVTWKLYGRRRCASIPGKD